MVLLGGMSLTPLATARAWAAAPAILSAAVFAQPKPGMLDKVFSIEAMPSVIVAKPLRTKRMIGARIVFQSQRHAVPSASVMTFQMVWNHVVFVAMRTMPPMSSAIAATTRPMGFAVSAAFR